MSAVIAKCQNEAMRIEEDSLHSSKSHFEAANLWVKLHLSLGIPAAILAAIAGVSALKECPVVAGILSFAVAALSALSTFLNPSERANAHLNAGNQYMSVRNRARIFREIESA